MAPSAQLPVDAPNPILIQGLMGTDIMECLAAYWDCPWVPSPLESFSCGEWRVNPISPLAQKSIFIVHDLGPWQRDAWMALGLLCQYAVANHALSIHLIAPYLPYGRQNGGENGPGFNVCGTLLKALHIHGLISIDPHDAECWLEWPIQTQNLMGSHIFFSQWNSKKSIDWVISPDQGGSLRAKQFAEKWTCPWTQLRKKRTENGIHIAHDNPNIFFQKHCLIVDDIVDTGHTLAQSVSYLRQNGAQSITACATHGIFSMGCLDRLEHSGLNDLWVTNSTPTLEPIHSSGKHGSLSIHRVSWAHAYAP
jgi:ribose-phosphate pyrophosphokinase